MEDAHTFMKSTQPAAEGLFKLLNQYGWDKMRAFVALTKSTTRAEVGANNAEFRSKDIAREVIAGSILQIAYVAIAKYASPGVKSANAVHFESEINRLIEENPERVRRREPFKLPSKFCVGRDIGHLPLGMVVYAGRNQYNHFYEGERLSIVNELVFNHLHVMNPEPPSGLSFDLRPNQLFSYSILTALGWIDSSRGLGYPTYERDMCSILGVEL